MHRCSILVGHHTHKEINQVRGVLLLRTTHCPIYDCAAPRSHLYTRPSASRTPTARASSPLPSTRISCGGVGWVEMSGNTGRAAACCVSAGGPEMPRRPSPGFIAKGWVGGQPRPNTTERQASMLKLNLPSHWPCTPHSCRAPRCPRPWPQGWRPRRPPAQAKRKRREPRLIADTQRVRAFEPHTKRHRRTLVFAAHRVVDASKVGTTPRIAATQRMQTPKKQHRSTLGLAHRVVDAAKGGRLGPQRMQTPTAAHSSSSCAPGS